MKRTRLRRAPLAMLLALLVAGPLLAGCVQVQVTDERADAATPTPYGVLASPPQDDDLAILGIEFNPPLRFEEVLAAGKLAMLVAVENRGSFTEGPVSVEAVLVGLTDADKILDRTAQLDSIAPGEVKLVRFENLSLIPYRPSFTMTVSVRAVPGETRIADNERTYRFQVVVPPAVTQAPAPAPTVHAALPAPPAQAAPLTVTIPLTAPVLVSTPITQTAPPAATPQGKE
jgi:hypothetical protein